MIVPMRLVHVAVRTADRDRLVSWLHDRGIVHLSPVDRCRATPREETRRAMDVLDRALRAIEGIPASGQAPDLPPIAAADSVLDTERRIEQSRSRLVALHRELERLGIWEDVELGRIEALRSAGIDVVFLAVPASAVSAIAADCRADLGALPGGRRLVGAACRGGGLTIPEGCTRIEPPARDAASLRGEAASLDESLRRDGCRLAELARLSGAMREERSRLGARGDVEAALGGSAGSEDLFALRGWAPREEAEALADGLSRARIPAAVRIYEPGPDDEPPTLVRRPRLVRPIEGLFRILGTVGGYREPDVSLPFLVALPIFAAMLISDGGYSSLLLVLPLAFYRRSCVLLGRGSTHLLVVVGGVGLAWGLLCGSFFGRALYAAPLPVDIGERSRATLMLLSFVLGATHVSAAHLWQAFRLYPNPRCVARVGWAAFTWGVFGLVGALVLGTRLDGATPWPYLLGVGALLAMVFHWPGRNIPKMLGLGILSFPLPMLSAFSDVISYVRLMAVGLASSVLAASFNDLAMSMGNWPARLLVLVFGHGMNLGLALIALFAHGVRLNMLEFSGTLGMAWNGYPFRPFSRESDKEHDDDPRGR